VAVIISILASMVLFAVADARLTGEIAATKSTIAKLDTLLRRQWMSYQTRRVPLPPGSTAADRLAALRQVMRMELPGVWEDVTTDSALFTQSGGNLPALNRAYRQYKSSTSADNQFSSAECLYMIVTVAFAAESRGMFDDSQIGDVDGDGAKEFIDAWGTPIRFIRWPIGFVNDDYHDGTATSAERIGFLSDIMPPMMEDPSGNCWPDANARHDPFDVMAKDEVAFFVYPLIYSAGPDKIFDIYGGVLGANDNPYIEVSSGTGSAQDITARPTCQTYKILEKKDGDSWPSGAAPRYAGRPKDLNSWEGGASVGANGELNHYDNIHNHSLNAGR